LNNIERLCVITDEISQDFEHALDVITEYGIKSVDLRKIWKKNIALFTDAELEQLKEALNKRNMKVIVITGPTGKCLLPDAKFTTKKKSLMRNPEYNLSLFDRIIEISDFFNTPYIRIFSFLRIGYKSSEKRWEKMMGIIRTLVNKAEEFNKVLLLENDLGMNIATIDQTKRFFEEINSDAIKLVLDPGNYFMERDRTDPEAYEYFYRENLVGHIHVKDPKRKLPLLGALFGVVGEGKIDYRALFKQALDYEYSGYFSLETHSLRNKEKVSRASLKNLVNWLKELD